METDTMNGKRKKAALSEGGAKAWQVAVLMVLSAALAVLIVLFVLASGKTRYAIVDTADEHDAGVISRLLTDVDDYYYFDEEAPSSGELLNIAAHTIVNSIGDEYAQYFTDEEYTEFQNQINGNYKGVGVLVSFAEGRGLKVERSYKDNPAYIAGIRDGDLITEADGKSLASLSLGDASALLMGEDGTYADLTVLRDGKRMEFRVRRGDVNIKRVYVQTLENNIGYLRIESFTGNAESEFDAALDSLLTGDNGSGGITSLIIDLRNNPGGELGTVVKILDRILPACTITTIKGKLVTVPRIYSSTDDERLPEHCALAVLVNGNSASASEIFASAIQDNNAGRIFGSNTFGKGIVQSAWNLGDGMGYLKLTTDVYITPKGKLIHGVGVAPDIPVEQTEGLEELDPYFLMRDYMSEDKILAAAVDYLTK